jgi:hypothetical protein
VAKRSQVEPDWPTPAAPTVTGEAITLDAVEPVSLAEEMDDDIPF